MDRGDRQLFLWWAVLLALTLLSFESRVQWLDRGSTATILVIGIALIKIRIVILHFMEVADAPWALRAPLEMWIFVLGAALLGLWYGLLA